MAKPEPPIHLDGESARAGATPHMTRYILGASLALVIIAYAIILWA
ncbi:hypothetical protein ACFQ1E_05045 [Sphingomonas canadensis]|uniref:Energy transducer TonB n=1 Tax=Sphingomonas canadensis TaxID=1219257 RepID=A0ABW3H2V1_9SPHN|nr:hypothetical protein [Sphingomonas canadensis]MCW3835845.1 hypothetical protein [Sphingomonas canadensis]